MISWDLVGNFELGHQVTIADSKSWIVKEIT